MRPQAWQIIVLVIALILLFGWRRLPDMARSVGQSMRVFKSEVDQMTSDGDSRSSASRETVEGRAVDPRIAEADRLQAEADRLRRQSGAESHGEFRGGATAAPREDSGEAPSPGGPTARDDHRA